MVNHFALGILASENCLASERIYDNCIESALMRIETDRSLNSLQQFTGKPFSVNLFLELELRRRTPLPNLPPPQHVGDDTSIYQDQDPHALSF